ncbi:MAG: BlaI/MecI/CopY family transcriptional regulator [Clostridiales bacterium]|jgi:predicted transcriptional regulator|nr:BlaI/MecI/CopY family transcriptional regulator [Clostridiales bacterium]
MAEGLKLFDAEYKFACIVWENEPVPSGKLAELCAEKLGWKRTTAYTVLRKLVERGVLVHKNTMVTAIAKKEDVQTFESATVVDRAFDGSLPSFVSAFLKTKKLTAKEAEEIQRLIDEHTEA